ncbi:serine/threonine protein kinase, partial [Myxococcota bacterium]|nr:serine/threonine protein kinase [Myxococcota bacterium]
MSAPEATHYLGQILTGQYRIDAVLGQGGMGVVFRARQLSVGRDVAIKILLRQLAHDPQAILRFENEARIVSRLRHPNTIRLYDCQRTEEGDLFFVTELLSGKPLSELLATEGRLTIDRALGITDQICRSLAEAHASGIVHRDLKPANVFIDRIGLDDVVKVLDFGIAKNIESAGNITRTGGVNGTPAYMSPEQVLAKPIDARSDLYSLGIVLYEMLSGAPPFQSPSFVELLLKHVQEPPRPLRETIPELEVPDALEALLAAMLAKSPDDRPASVDVVLARLSAVRAQLTAARDAPPAPTAPPPSPPATRTTFDAHSEDDEALVAPSRRGVLYAAATVATLALA